MPPPPPDDPSSSSSEESSSSSGKTKPPPTSQPSEQSSSSSEPGSNYESSSSQTITPSSPGTMQSSSSSIAGSSSSSSTQGGQSSSSKVATVTGACVENNKKADFTCNWDGYKSGSILTPGTTMKPASYTLPSGCTAVSWSYAPDTNFGVIYDCNELDERSGFPALGSQNYVLFAKLTCNDGVHINACNPTDGWSSKRAPELTGMCKWDKNPTTTARGAVPSGVTVVDTDNICGTTKSVVYKYDGGTKTWPSTGILPEWSSWDKKHTETYTDVEATLNCPAYAAPVTVPCPPLEVHAGVDYVIECTCPGDGSSCLNEKYCKVGSTTGNSVTLKVDECVEINVVGWNDQYFLPDVVGMRCSGGYNSFTVSVNGKSITSSQGTLIPLGKIKLGDNELGTLCLTSIGSEITSLKCTGPGM